MRPRESNNFLKFFLAPFLPRRKRGRALADDFFDRFLFHLCLIKYSHLLHDLHGFFDNLLHDFLYQHFFNNLDRLLHDPLYDLFYRHFPDHFAHDYLRFIREGGRRGRGWT